MKSVLNFVRAVMTQCKNEGVTSYCQLSDDGKDLLSNLFLTLFGEVEVGKTLLEQCRLCFEDGEFLVLAEPVANHIPNVVADIKEIHDSLVEFSYKLSLKTGVTVIAFCDYLSQPSNLQAKDPSKLFDMLFTGATCVEISPRMFFTSNFDFSYDGVKSHFDSVDYKQLILAELGLLKIEKNGVKLDA